MLARSKKGDFESEELRRRVTRTEAEKAKLEERVEVEGAERVTVVASITHERDFLLRQASVRRNLSISSYIIGRKPLLSTVYMGLRARTCDGADVRRTLLRNRTRARSHASLGDPECPGTYRKLFSPRFQYDDVRTGATK